LLSIFVRLNTYQHGFDSRSHPPRVALSDIHISVYDEASRIEDLEAFLRRNVKVIRPYLLLISDAFNVPSGNAQTNYFRTHGVQGHRLSNSYSFNLGLPFGKYSFIALDACPDPGLMRPLNFFGHIAPETEEDIREYVKTTQSSNLTFWFGHYPTSTIVSPFALRSIIGSSAYAYFCGHLHTLLGWVPKMYGLQPQGFLELELGDWRDNRYYRIVAVDHDLVSFIDVRFSPSISSAEWPVILVTNPKHANFLLPHKEPFYRIEQSDHIRILVWSPYSVEYVSVSIDGVKIGNATRARIPPNATVPDLSPPIPLFVLPWNPAIWLTGSAHTIQVVAQDVNGNRREITQPFLVSGTPPWNFPFIPSLFVTSDHTFNIRTLFYVLWSYLFGLIVIPRLFSQYLHRHAWSRNRLVAGLLRLASTDTFAYPLLIYLVYVAAGPIFMGYLVDEHFAVVFSFGVYVAGSLIAESLTYMYESIQVRLHPPCFLRDRVAGLHLAPWTPLSSQRFLSIGKRTSSHFSPKDCVYHDALFVMFTFFHVHFVHNYPGSPNFVLHWLSIRSTRCPFESRPNRARLTGLVSCLPNHSTVIYILRYTRVKQIQYTEQYSIVHLIYTRLDRRDEAYSMNARYSLRNKNTDPSPSASMNNIFWFIQITDLHLSIHQDASRSTDFEKFCNNTVRTIRPEFVSVSGTLTFLATNTLICSGDITDARSAVFISSKQYLSEWSSYRAAIRKSGILDLTTVYDIRGNHGN
ncbi:hypothetical protein X801_05375, partial [Opisthorchis viverrini]